jgi:hypothetical protein
MIFKLRKIYLEGKEEEYLLSVLIFHVYIYISLGN